MSSVLNKNVEKEGRLGTTSSSKKVKDFSYLGDAQVVADIVKRKGFQKVYESLLQSIMALVFASNPMQVELCFCLTRLFTTSILTSHYLLTLLQHHSPYRTYSVILRRWPVPS